MDIHTEELLRASATSEYSKLYPFMQDRLKQLGENYYREVVRVAINCCRINGYNTQVRMIKDLWFILTGEHLYVGDI